MESKRKKPQVRKGRKATQEHPKSQQPQDKPTQAEALVKFNGDLIESLISHQGWSIVEDLIDEGIASVSGRKTNGYYYDGELVRGNKNKEYLVGYQEGLSQLYNRIKDFIIARNKLVKRKKEEEQEVSGEMYNPFMEKEE